MVDVRMPGMDGPATLDALRGVRPDLPCLFLTGGSGYTGADLAGRGAGVATKPVSLAALGDALTAATSAGVSG